MNFNIQIHCSVWISIFIQKTSDFCLYREEFQSFSQCWTMRLSFWDWVSQVWLQIGFILMSPTVNFEHLQLFQIFERPLQSVNVSIFSNVASLVNFCCICGWQKTIFPSSLDVLIICMQNQCFAYNFVHVEREEEKFVARFTTNVVRSADGSISSIWIPPHFVGDNFLRFLIPLTAWSLPCTRASYIGQFSIKLRSSIFFLL